MFRPLKAYIPKPVREMLKRIPIRFTKNQQYDFQTNKIVDLLLNKGSNTVDVGCFKGEILDILYVKAYQGQHFAFEPIPDKFSDLARKYKDQNNIHLYNLALSNSKGSALFNHVITNPSYSGLKKRDYDLPNEKDEKISVATDSLDNIIPVNLQIDLIKIDVEGAEYLVMEGAQKIITRCKPVIIFEHGLGGSDHYGNGPDKVFDFLANCGLNISNLDKYLQKKSPLSKGDFEKQYFKKLNYYFIAHP